MSNNTITHHKTVEINGRDTRVRTVMGQIRQHKKDAERFHKPWSFDIRARDISGIATAVMAAGLLGDAKNYDIKNVEGENGSTNTWVTFSFHKDNNIPCLVGKKADYDRLKEDEDSGNVPGCWYISGLRDDRTLSSSVAAFSARAHKSVEEGTKMHLGSAGSASRVLFVMVAKAIERQTHAVEQLTIHNDKVVLDNGNERDVTFVHVVLTPIIPEDDSGAMEIVREVLDDLIENVVAECS
tara:strand:+ start:1410 stop:2129 length:720 start_codon:yes stop_codon:yes gene_type:complete